jgi:hypothetical protein
MVVASPGHIAGLGYATSPVRRETPARYVMFGLRVYSDLPLPIPAAPSPSQVEPDVVFARARPGSPYPASDGPVVAESSCPCADHRGEVVMRVWRGPGGIWVWHERIATCHITQDARRVEVYPEPRADDRALGFLLAGQIATFVLHQQGYPCLHASAVLTDEGALAFLGPKGQGKSTIAAGFLRRGAALLADDIVSLQHDSEGIAVRPSLPIMKLWPQSVEGALALAEDLPDLVAGYEKKLLTVGGRYYLAGSPAPLRAIYVLDRYDPLAAGCTAVKIDRLRSRDGLMALVGHASLREYLPPAELAGLLPFYIRAVTQAPVRVLRYPHGFEHQGSVQAAIRADLREDR